MAGSRGWRAERWPYWEGGQFWYLWMNGKGGAYGIEDSMMVEDVVAIDQLAPEELDSGEIHVGGGSGVREGCSFGKALGEELVPSVNRGEHGARCWAVRHWEVIVRIGGLGWHGRCWCWEWKHFLVQTKISRLYFLA